LSRGLRMGETGVEQDGGGDENGRAHRALILSALD
jgi:hypothetical protein